jgi:hypothetical protein
MPRLAIDAMHLRWHSRNWCAPVGLVAKTGRGIYDYREA